MLLIVGPSPERSGGIATWIRLVRGHFTATGRSSQTFTTDKAHGGTGSLPARIGDGAAVASRFAATLRDARPRVVHICCGSGWGLREAGVLGALAQAFGAQVVLHLHAASLFERMDAHASERVLSLAALRTADHVAVLSPALARGLADRGVAAARISVVPNGVALPASPPPLPRWPLTLVLLGSVEERKGLSVLTEALGGLPEVTRAALRVRWCGPLVATDQQVGAAEAVGVAFLGVVKPAEAQRQLAGAHGLLLPSLREGLPFAVLEALALGRPVLASNVGALADTLREGGELVPPGDSLALRAALQRWVDDPERVRALARGARADVRRGNTLEHTAAALLPLWERAWR